MSCFCSEHYVQLVGSDEAALGPEITLQCWGVTLAKHRRRRQGVGGWERRMGGEVWTHSLRQGEGKGRGGRPGNLVGRCDSLFSSSAFSVFKHLPQDSHTRLPPLVSLLSFPPHLHLSPFLLSHYPLHLRSSALLSNQHRYNYTDTVATMI